MDHQRLLMRAGAAVIAFAIILRLIGGGFFAPLGQFLESPGLWSFLVYLQTGRAVRLPPEMEAPPPETTLPDDPTLPSEDTEVFLPVFSPGDMQNIEVMYGCSYRPDLGALLQQKLQWDLTGQGPKVLIIHTHATESYTRSPGESYQEEVAYRTLDEHYNMVSIGDEVARVLEAGGIGVIHDRTYHDHPSYNDAYVNARNAVARYLAQYPSIELVLDIHRDAAGGENGTQLKTHGTVGGQPSSQLMVVVGTDASGNHHPNWQTNLALGLKLTAVLERADPGLTRPISLRSERFNMDLTPGSLLIEIGAAGDTHDEAMLAANALARGILTLARGTS
jgi:stage II sporulation protein P